MADNFSKNSGSSSMLVGQIGIVLILTIPILLVAALNYSGFCIRRFRYINVEDRFKAVFDNWNQKTHYPVVVNGISRNLEREKIYASFEEFLSQNPDCCELSPDKPIELPPPSFFDRITGYYSGSVVFLQFEERFFDENGDIIVATLEINNVLQNCGEVKW